MITKNIRGLLPTLLVKMVINSHFNNKIIHLFYIRIHMEKQAEISEDLF